MKMFIIFSLLLTQQLLANPSSRLYCVTRETAVTHSGLINQAMWDFPKRMEYSHKGLAQGIAIGYCENLSKTSVLAVASGKTLPNYPEECLGIKFYVLDKKLLQSNAERVTKTESSLINGSQGAAILSVRGVPVRVPICMEYWDVSGRL